MSTANNEGLWTDRTGPLTLLLREGSRAPGMQPGVVFGSGQFLGSAYTFRLVQVNHDGRMAVQGNPAGTGDRYLQQRGHLRGAGTATRVMREGDPAPGAGGATFGGNSVNLQNYSLSYNSLGQVAFDVMLGEASTG